MSELNTVSVVEKKLNDLSKKIVEIKKKIQLSEGQRKANFEETQAKKNDNAKKIASLKKEIKELYVDSAKARNNDEAADRILRISRETSAIVRKRGLDKTIQKISEENIRLQKSRDLLRYQFEKRKERLETLMHEYEELLKGKKRKIFKKKLEDPLRKKIVSLEVQLERVRMMQIKSCIIRRKYKSVYAKLKERSASYASSIKELENDIKEHENEMERLRIVKEEAIELRENMQEKFVNQEIEVTNSGNERENIIQDFRNRVAERKAELERLERMIFPTRQREDYDGTQAKIYGQDTADEITKEDLIRLEDAFAKLRNVTGVSVSEDILNRFLGQRATKENLQKMKTKMEEEKMNLERKRQELANEIEARKFSETKNAEEDVEETEKANKKMDEELARQRKAETACDRLKDLLKEVTKVLQKLYTKSQGTTDSIGMEEDSIISSGPLKLLSLLNENVNKVMEIFGGQDTYFKMMDDALTEKLETLSITTSLEGKATRTGNTPLFSKFPTWTSSAVAPSEDEEEVPTRNVLKRQAQLLVEMKSRRKGLGFKR